MKTKTILLVVGVFIAIGIYLTSPELNHFKKEYKSAQCGFSINFYGNPTESEEAIPTSNSVFSRKITYKSSKGAASYRVDCFELKQPGRDAANVINGVLETLESNGKYKLIRKNDMEISGNMGKEYILDFKDQDIVAKARITVKGKWLYQTMVVTKRSDIDGKTVMDYLDSFRIE